MKKIPNKKLNKNKNKSNVKQAPAKNYRNLKEFKVTDENELLLFLLEQFKSQSRNSVKSLLSSHRVSVDGAPVTQFNFKLYRGYGNNYY